MPSYKRSRKNQNVSISSDSVYDSDAYDPVKTRLSESEVGSRNRTLPLVYSSASSCGSNSTVFT